MIKIENVSAGYRKKEVLHGVSLSVEDSRIVTIIGQNGCGKSTLIKAMLGFVPMTQGSVQLNSVAVSQASPQKVAQTAAYLPQMHQNGDISVGRLVLHGRFPYLSYPRSYRKEDKEIAYNAMERMGIAELSQVPLSELSGGLRQKAYIAMALAQQTPIIVMDEPTTFLDIGEQMKFMQLCRELTAEGKTVVLVLHDVISALSISDRIAVMHHGRIIQFGAPKEILESDALQKLYGIRVCTIETQNGVQYYYERRERI